MSDQKGQLRKFLAKNAEFQRERGDYYVYKYHGRIVVCSKGTGDYSRDLWHRILKQQLHITQEEFNAGL